MLGDSIPVAAGIAMGARMRRRGLVAMAWIGEGATSTGPFHEGLNFAAVQRIPLVVVAEDNKYAYSTPVAKQMAITRIDERAAAYGIPHELVDGNDMLAVYDVARRMVDRARAGEGASLIGVDTMRMQGHAQHDDARYVPKALLDEWAARDPLPRFRKAILDRGAGSEKDLNDVDRQTRDYAAREAELAAGEPMPDPATVARGVYAGDDFAVPRLEFVRSPFATPGA
jgi:TPP-dependent pyruvate/acetoin dehydrogenase alpha subunit